MPENERNAWDHANRQGENRDFNDKGSTDEKYLKHEQNPNKDADGYGSESGRSDHSHYDSGLGSRSGNNTGDERSNVTSSRSHENLGEGSSGASGRASGDMGK
jgi:hypothetical protein